MFMTRGMVPSQVTRSSVCATFVKAGFVGPMAWIFFVTSASTTKGMAMKEIRPSRTPSPPINGPMKGMPVMPMPEASAAMAQTTESQSEVSQPIRTITRAFPSAGCGTKAREVSTVTEMSRPKQAVLTFAITPERLTPNPSGRTMPHPPLGLRSTWYSPVAAIASNCSPWLSAASSVK